MHSVWRYSKFTISLNTRYLQIPQSSNNVCSFKSMNNLQNFFFERPLQVQQVSIHDQKMWFLRGLCIPKTWMITLKIALGIPSDFRREKGCQHSLVYISVQTKSVFVSVNVSEWNIITCEWNYLGYFLFHLFQFPFFHRYVLHNYLKLSQKYLQAPVYIAMHAQTMHLSRQLTWTSQNEDFIWRNWLKYHAVLYVYF